MSRLLIVAFAAIGLAACTPGYDLERSQRAAMKFDAELAGLVPGPTQSCLPSRSTANVVATRNGVLLFREGRTVYANSTTGGCDELADSQYALVTDTHGVGSLCSGTMARVVDLSAGGSLRGVCTLGEFTRYRRP